MDYGNGKYNGDFQFHPLKRQEVCSEIASQVDSCAYLEPSSSVCGDGIVEVHKGEECECPQSGQTTCVDCNQCRLVRPSQCVRGTQCCSDQGRFLPSNATCTLAQANNSRRGVCIRGTCQVNACSATQTVCDAPEECRVRCAPLSAPQSCSMSFMHQPDGLACRDGAGVCQGGICTLIASTTTTTANQISSSSNPGNNSTTTCTDLLSPWWDADSVAYTCRWYAARPSMCDLYGFRLRNFGFTAGEACCACGGGRRLPAPSTSPTASPVVDVTESPTGVPCPGGAKTQKCRRARSKSKCLGSRGCSWCRRSASKPKTSNKKNKKNQASSFRCAPGPCALARQCSLV